MIISAIQQAKKANGNIRSKNITQREEQVSNIFNSIGRLEKLQYRTSKEKENQISMSAVYIQFLKTIWYLTIEYLGRIQKSFQDFKIKFLKSKKDFI